MSGIRVVGFLVAFGIAGCGEAAVSAEERSGSGAAAGDAVAAPAPASAAVEAADPAAGAGHPVDVALAKVLVHKTPYCGCCAKWVEHMRAAGFEVEVREHDDLEPIRRLVGVPAGKGSCHTAVVGGYFVEGHVPAEDVRRLLAERPDARGLTAPGMPPGSPGMELPNGATPPYDVLIVDQDGAATVFAEHGTRTETTR